MNEQKTNQSPKKVEIRRHSKKLIISLWLDNYENFFSDFDPRPFSQRSISDDFLDEAKKVTHETKAGFFDVTYLVPHNRRNKTEEEIIKKRLHAHFKKHFTILDNERKKMIKKGLLSCLLGVFLMFSAASMVYLQTYNPLFNYILVLLEPSAWFTWWYGLDHIFYVAKANKKELEFNRKMLHAEIRFDAY